MYRLDARIEDHRMCWRPQRIKREAIENQKNFFTEVRKREGVKFNVKVKAALFSVYTEAHFRHKN